MDPNYTLADNVNHNFVMSGSQFGAIGQFTTIDDVPGALATVVIAIHGGDIVGGYMSTDKVAHGLLMSDGQVTTIDAPGGATFTNVTNMNSRGEMVGRYTVNGVTHAYLLSGGEFNTFDYPGAAVGDSIVQLVDQLNKKSSAMKGEDLFKATNKTTQALIRIRKPISTLQGYETLIDDLYFLFRESVGTRLVAAWPTSFAHVNDLRTDLRHDIDHGDAAKVRAKKRKIGKTFELYAGGGPPTLSSQSSSL